VNRLANFRKLIQRADRFGVLDDFRARFRKLRAAGVDPEEAGERALREAVNAANPRAALGVTLVFREGKA
jgi:hypothetical protein